MSLFHGRRRLSDQKRNHLLLLGASLGPLFLAGAVRGAEKLPYVIYGNDDRVELAAETDPGIRQLADSTIAMVKTDQLKTNDDGSIHVLGGNYGTDNNLCRSERFFRQEAAAYCSGVLITDRIIATAGHCVARTDTCATTSFVFNYALANEMDVAVNVPASNVYSCKKVLTWQMPADGADYGLVELDRPVVGHAPVPLRRQSRLSPGDGVILIGHPSGLPSKVAAGAKVRSWANDYFIANTDSYAGNSGSAVFDAKTMELSGLLVRGERDFRYDQRQKCNVSFTCTDSSCRGEDVTAADVVAAALDAVTGTAPKP